MATDVFITPYLVPEQTSSGVIAYALGCGKVVVSTPFLYAKEMLKDGRGIFINFKDSQSIFSAIDFIFSHPEERKKIEKRAYTTAQKMLWSKVSKEYLKVFKDGIKNYEKK